MSYNLKFHPDALSEWKCLTKSVRGQLKTKLAERLENPIIPSARVSGGANLFKIKLRDLGIRLVYHVDENVVTVTVLSVGKRERNAAYNTALGRIITPKR